MAGSTVIYFYLYLNVKHNMIKKLKKVRSSNIINNNKLIFLNLKILKK